MIDNNECSNYLNINNLSVIFRTHSGEIPAVRGISLSMCKGEILALVGESGSGKSTLCRAIMRLLPHNADIVSGNILLDDIDLLELSDRRLKEIRGRDVSMIFQEPVAALDPTLTIGRQIIEALRIHNRRIKHSDAAKRAVELLGCVGIENPELVFRVYPMQLSGGMCQRCAIAIALSSMPGILIADEPTTALDVTIQAEILKLLNEIRRQNNMSIVFVTHDLGVAAQIADRIAVMKDGEIVETGSTSDIFHRADNPYTISLLEALPYNHMRRDNEQGLHFGD